MVNNLREGNSKKGRDHFSYDVRYKRQKENKNHLLFGIEMSGKKIKEFAC